MIARRPDAYVNSQAILAIALKLAGADDEATAASKKALPSPTPPKSATSSAWALFTYGTAHRDVAPHQPPTTPCQGPRIAQYSGSRQIESSIASMLSPLAIAHGEPADALDYAMLSIRYYYDSGNVYLVKNPLSVRVVLFDWLVHY